MSATSPLYGNPSTELLVNHTGSGGAVLIKDSGTVVFELKPGGEIISKVDPLHLHGQKDANDTTIIFSDGVKTQELLAWPRTS